MVSYSLRGTSKHWKKILLAFIIILICTFVGGVVALRYTYFNNLRPISASQKSQSITIPAGASIKQIGEQLKDAGLIREAWVFEWYVRTKRIGNKIQAGTYSLRPNQSVGEIVTILAQGQIETDLVTILPAQRLDQVRKALLNAGFSEESVTNALNPALYKDHPALVDKPAEATLEGYLYPETFHKTAGTKPEAIIRASLDEMQKHLNPAIREGITSQGLSVHQGIILASIIEQEVSNPDDKKVVAQVFLRRLREGRALESDPTAFYGAILAGQPPTLTYESAYNTYKNVGLPPTPVSNVGVLSLTAVANPANTDYLFFVAGDDGKTYFSHTIEEHEAKTREHCKKLCTLY